MRLLIILIIVTGCKSYEFGLAQYSSNLELGELNESLNNYRLQNSDWPSQKGIDSLRETSNYLKRFSFIKINNATYDTSLNILFKLEYPKFEDPIQSLEMSQEINVVDRGKYGHLIRWCINDLVIQNNIHLGTRTKLISNEKRKFRQWERERKTSRQLIIQDLKTKETRNLTIETHMRVFSQKDSMNYISWYKDPKTNTSYYWEGEWVLSTINTSDSTVNIDLYNSGQLRKRLKFNEIDSLTLKSKRGTFKIIGVNDTAHNTVFK